jgi:hypothetical protein
MRDGHEYFNRIEAIRSFWLAGSGEGAEPICWASIACARHIDLV